MPFGIDSDQTIGTYESTDTTARGEWIWKPPYMACSVCGRHSINRYRSKYCQHCGAKMKNYRGLNAGSDGEKQC